MKGDREQYKHVSGTLHNIYIDTHVCVWTEGEEGGSGSERVVSVIIQTNFWSFNVYKRETQDASLS